MVTAHTINLIKNILKKKIKKISLVKPPPEKVEKIEIKVRQHWHIR